MTAAETICDSVTFQSTGCRWLTLLKRKLRPACLPGTTDCPLCSGRLWVYHDYFGPPTSQWVYCDGCRFSGTPAELVSIVFDEPFEQVLRRLPIDNRPGVAHHSSPVHHCASRDLRTTVRRMFAESSASFITLSGETARCLRGRLKLFKPTIEQSRWQSSAGRFVGMISCNDFDRVFRPSGTRSPIFEGGGWNELAIFPAWDLPGRICGFACLGRQGRDPQDLRYRHVIAGKRGGKFLRHDNSRFVEAGLFMLPAVFEEPPHGEFGDTVFAIGSVVDAASLHIKHSMDHSDTLPVVAWWGDRSRATHQTWDLLYGRPVVLWPKNVDACTILQARRCDGRIVVDTPEAMREKLLRSDPVQLLRWLQENAIPWRDALERTLAAMPHAKGRRLIQELELPDAERRRLSVLLPSPTSGRMADADDVLPTDMGTIGAGESTCRARPDGWYVGTRDLDRVIPFHFTIDREVYCPHRDHHYFEGRLTCERQVHRYRATEKDWERGELRWFRQHIQKLGLPDPGPVINSSFRARELARQLGGARQCTIRDAIGWDPAVSAFVFPNFRIAANGQVIAAEIPLTDVEPDCPCHQLGDYRELSPALVDWLSQPDSASGLAWAAAVAIVGELVLPLHGEGRRRIGCLTDAGPVLRALGCSEYAEEKDYVHRYPQLVGDSLMRRPTAIPPGSFVTVDVVDIAPSARHGGWHLLTADGADLRYLPDDLGMLVPNILHVIMSRRMEMPPGDNLFHRIAGCVSEYFEQIGGDPCRPLDACQRNAFWGTQKPAWIAGMLVSAFSVYAAGREKDCSVAGTDLVIRQSALQEYCAIGGYRKPSVNEIRRILAADCDLTVRPYYSARGSVRGPAWRLPQSWVRSRLERFGIPSPV